MAVIRSSTMKRSTRAIKGFSDTDQARCHVWIFPPFPLLNEAAVKGWSSKKYIGMGWQHVIILLATDSVFRNCPNTFLYISRKCSTKGLQTQIWPVVSRINFKKVMSQFLVFLKDQLVFINIVKKKYMCFHSSYLSFPPPPTVDGFD